MKVKDVLLADVAKRSAVSGVTVNFLLNRDDDGDGNENGKKAIGLDWQNNNFARASRFFVHFFFAYAAGLQRESAYGDKDFLFLFLNFDTVL